MEGNGTKLLLDRERLTEEEDAVSTSPTVTQSTTSNCHTSSDIKVTLENESVWNRFHNFGTEMILTKQGRRMFPCCRFRLSGLDRQRKYFLIMDIMPLDEFTYRWNGSSWEPVAVGEPQVPGQICVHPESPALGLLWMDSPVSFYKVKLTNDSTDQEGCVILRPMCRYQPRLRIVPFDPDLERTIVLDGPNVKIFSFPQTEFYAVTSYQNPQITQLKIDCNPFAMAFRENSQSIHPPRDQPKARSSAITHFQAQKISEDQKEGVVKNNGSACIPDSRIRLLYSGVDSPKEEEASVTKLRNSILSCPNADYSKNDGVTETVFNKCPVESVLGEHMAPLEFEPIGIENFEEPIPVMNEQVPTIGSTENSKSSEALDNGIGSRKGCTDSKSPTESLMSAQIQWKLESAAVSPPRPLVHKASQVHKQKPGHLCRRGRTPGGRKAKSKMWSKVTSKKPAPAVVTKNVPLHPDLEDVEGMLFVSFVEKEALKIQSENIKESKTSLPPTSATIHEHLDIHKANDVILPVVERIAKFEKHLLLYLKQQRHRQVIHPCLQDVGMKLSLLDPKLPIDLQYLGVLLPRPPANFEGLDKKYLRSQSSSPDAAGIFVSRTGKTNDLTKIKGWKDKFTTSPVQSVTEGPKNSSAFCSEMLDAYLENEAQQISDRVAVFSKCSASPVSYQLPSKSSSYVVTLDSLLKARSDSSSKVYSKPVDETLQPRSSPCTLSSAGSQHRSQGNKEKKRNFAQSFNAQQHAGPTLRASRPLRFVSRHGRNKQLGKSMLTWNSSEETTGHISNLQNPVIPVKVRNIMFLHKMEKEAVFHGKDRTHITTTRAKFALTSLLKYSKRRKRPRFCVNPTNAIACPKAFCQLGCVCDSLDREFRGPTHCRRVECMFKCTCFRHKVLLLHPSKETPVVHQGKKNSVMAFPLADPERLPRPPPAPSINTLWKKKTGEHDPEPIFIPVPPVFKNPSYVCTRLNHSRHQVAQEDKDPVYLYFESMMTCARVREYNSNPPPQIHILPNKKCLKESEQLNGNCEAGEPVKSPKIPETNSTETSKPLEATKLLEILSECNWEPHRSLLLGTLFQRLNNGRLSGSFCVGMYKIQLVSTTVKDVGRSSTVTYKVCISRANENETEGLQVKTTVKRRCLKSVETKVSETCKKQAQKATADIKAERKSSILEKNTPIKRRSVTIFERHLSLLNNAASFGYLKADMKKPGQPSRGLLNVNGKSYSKAKLQLGKLGALHPVNRIAALVAGRVEPTLQNLAKSKACPSKAPPVLKHVINVAKLSNVAVTRPTLVTVPDPNTAVKNVSSITPMNAILNTVGPPSGTIPVVPGGTRFVLVPVTPSNSAAAPHEKSVTSSTLPPGQQVVLQPALGMPGSNFLCQYNGQMIQLNPVSTGPLNQLPNSVTAGGTSHVIQTTTDANNLQMPLTSTPQMLLKPNNTPQTHSLSAKSGINIASGMAPFGNLQSSFTAKAVSFRICPPTTEIKPVGSEHSGKLPEPSNNSIVVLPGGFTLIKLLNSTVLPTPANAISTASNPPKISQNDESVTDSFVQSCIPSPGQNHQVSESIANPEKTSSCNSPQGSINGLNQSTDISPFNIVIKDEPDSSESVNTVTTGCDDWVPEGAVMVHKSDVSELCPKDIDDWPPNGAERILWIDSAEEERNLVVADESPATKGTKVEENIDKQMPSFSVSTNNGSEISFGCSGSNEQVMIQEDSLSVLVKTDPYNELTEIAVAGSEPTMNNQGTMGENSILSIRKENYEDLKEENKLLDHVYTGEQRLDSIKIESCSDSPKTDTSSMQDDVTVGPEDGLLIATKEEPSLNQIATELSEDLSKGLYYGNYSHIPHKEFSNEPDKPNTTTILMAKDNQENVEIAGNAPCFSLDDQTVVNSTPTPHLLNTASLGQKTDLNNFSPSPHNMADSFSECPNSIANLLDNFSETSQRVKQDCDDEEIVVDVMNLSEDEDLRNAIDSDEVSSSDSSELSSSDEEDSSNDSTSDSEPSDDTEGTLNEDDVESFEDSEGTKLISMLKVQHSDKHNVKEEDDWQHKDFTKLPTEELDKRLSHTEKERVRRVEMRQSFAALKKALNVEEQVKLYNHDILNQARLTIWALKDRSEYLQRRKLALQQTQSVYLSKITELSEKAKAEALKKQCEQQTRLNPQNALQTSVSSHSVKTRRLDNNGNPPCLGRGKAPNYKRKRSKKELWEPSDTSAAAVDKHLDSQLSPDLPNNPTLSGSSVNTENRLLTNVGKIGTRTSQLNSSELSKSADLLGDNLYQQDQNQRVEQCDARKLNQVVKALVSEPSNQESPAPSLAATGKDLKNKTLSELGNNKQASMAIVKENVVRKKRAKSDVVIEEALSNPDVLGPRQLRKRPPAVTGGTTKKRGGTANKTRRKQ